MSETVKFRVLYYIYLGHWLNRGIAAATWPPNMNTEPGSHTELWEPSPTGAFYSHLVVDSFDIGNVIGYGKPMGQCWTSTTRGKANGTVVRPASQVLTHAERWLYTEHAVERGDGPETGVWERSFTWAKREAQRRVDANKGYSYRDLSRFIMPLWLLRATRLADNGREICSEHVAQWLVDMGIFARNTIPSPRRLLRDVVRATHVPVRRLVDDVVVRDGQWRKVRS